MQLHCKPQQCVLVLLDSKHRLLVNKDFTFIGEECTETTARQVLNAKVFNQTGVDISTLVHDNSIVFLKDNVPTEAFIFDATVAVIFKEPSENYSFISLSELQNTQSSLQVYFQDLDLI